MRVGGFQATNTAIQNPFTFYTVSDNDWSSTHNYDYWNKNFTSDPGITNAAIAKTIYSPSPSGYVEPKTAAYTGITSTGGNTTNGGQFNVTGTFNNGWTIFTQGWKTGTTLFLKALGFRDSFSGRPSGKLDIYFFNLNYNIWSAGASSTINGRSFYTDPSGLYPQYVHGRSYGLNCHSVLE